MTGGEPFVEAVPKLVERGIGVRIATTLEDPDAADPNEMERLCELHRAMGVSDEDHVVRPIVNRGRAVTNDMGVLAGFEQLDPELTLTADGAFYNPFAPTVRGGELDTDLLTDHHVGLSSCLLAAARRRSSEESSGSGLPTSATGLVCARTEAGTGTPLGVSQTMANVTIASTGPREFKVEVRDAGQETSHRVTVPESLIEELELSEEDHERVGRESFDFLLEREPPSSIMSEFSLDVISGYFPDYPEELRRRLS